MQGGLRAVRRTLVWFPERRGLFGFPSVGNSLLCLQPRFLCLLQPPAGRCRPSKPPAEALLLRAVDWTRPPVPTELISVLISHTGSVQQEQESSPRAISLPVCECPEARELRLHSRNDRPHGMAVVPSVRGPLVWVVVEDKAPWPQKLMPPSPLEGRTQAASPM